MADSKPKEFRTYKDAYSYAVGLTNGAGSVRYIGALGPSKWLVGTFAQLSTELGLEPLTCVGAAQRMRRTDQQINDIYSYWNEIGDVRRVSKKFGVSIPTVYRIIHAKRDNK